MKKVSTIINVCVLMAIVIGVSGCRTPRIGDGMRTGVPRARDGAGGVGGNLTFPGSEDWMGLDESLTGVGGGEPLERRWEGVAVYFAYDRATIGASERPKIDSVADYLRQRPAYYVVVEGHCDDRGSDEYNRALGERRALAVRDYLVSLGIAENRIKTLSYGEDRPAVTDATTESQHALNRRAEFLFGLSR